MFLSRPDDRLSAKNHSHKISDSDRNRIILLCHLNATDHLDAEFPTTNRLHGLTESEFAFLAMLCLIELRKQGQYLASEKHIPGLLTGVKNDSATNLARAFS